MTDHSLEPLPPTESLVAVLTVMRSGSLSAAAEHLGVTHGAVSRRIAGVEAWLGASLFERHGRGMRATATGEHFARRLEESFAALAGLASEIRTRGDRKAVRLGVLPSVARLWVLPRIAQLEGDGELDVQLITDHRMARLEAGEADLAIRFGSGRWPGATSTLLFEESLFPVAAPPIARRLAGRPPAALLEEIALHDSGASDWSAWRRAAGLRRDFRRGRRFVDHDMVLQAARLGLGVALARMPLSEGDLAGGGLVRLGDLSIPGKGSHYLVLRSNETRGAVLRLADRILASAGAPPAART